jgi:hypothetical protein
MSATNQKMTTLPLIGNHYSTTSSPAKNRSDRKTTTLPQTDNSSTMVMLQPNN